MDREKDDGLGFRVVDKRRFDSSGESRPGEEKATAERKDAQPKKEQPKEKPVEKQSHSTPKMEVDGRTNVSPQTVQEQDTQPQGMEGVDFSSFLISLATQALVMLGEVPNPESQQVMYHPEAARETIEIIGMLQAKTKGNLTPEEGKLLEDVLASLRMAYVRKAGLK